ncbi:MAG: rRNA maturation RNase YbeY [Clostridia bacterium]|nr:rRNA maturation RNase YbeY [Clostridia bacterium]
MTEVLLGYINEQSAVDISDELVETMRASAHSVLCGENLSGKFEISLSIVDKPSIRALNAAHRGIDKPTDVLSFPLGEGGAYPQNYDTGAVLLGDIVICAERAVEQAEEYGHSVRREFGFLCAHSVLHLLGYDHVESAQEAAVMEQKQEAALAAIGLQRTL